MEYEIERTICKKCSGEKKCTKMCDIHMCKALVNYIKNVDISETKIGEFSSRTYKGKQDLVVSGHQVYGITLEVGSILTDISTILDASKKFNNAMGSTVAQMMKYSREELGLTVEEGQSVLNFMNKFNSNKIVILPFKPETACIVSTPKAYQSETEALIDTIVWRTNKDTHKLEASVKFKFVKGSGMEQSLTYKMSEYLETFRIKALSLQGKGEKRDNSIIKMSDCGIIKPIEVEWKDTSVAVDNTYIYYTDDGITRIIGGWNTSGELVTIEDIKGKHMTKINENLNLIKKHKKYIAPYMMYESNTLRV